MIQIASPQIGKEEREAVDRVLRSGIIAQGPEVAKFEEEFAKVCGVKHAVAACNGTTAGHLVMLASGIGPGDEVITTPFTFFATASVVMMAGAKPVFVDVEDDGFCLDPKKVESAITDKTKAIHPVHLYGELADMPSFIEIAEKHNLLLIEDSAQAHCANSWEGNAGSFGKAGWFSFYPTKNMTTSEGGIITTNDEEFANKCKIIRAHGMSAQYQHTEFGYNYRMTDISAAIGREQLKKLPNFNVRRREIAEMYNSELSDLVITPKNRRGHVFHQYTIRSSARDELREFLMNREINTGIYYPSVLYNYQSMAAYQSSCPNAENLINEVLSLPVHPALSNSDVFEVISSIKAFFE
ncbi:MAG: DegT/DnrJ/EryC1/StrS family aminotransferase [Candidatus Poseidoniales archaeon]|tara:strand:+ start:1104 stop:2165 length:1062 start_codon:yes stop_codon:yes gene_type:complete